MFVKRGFVQQVIRMRLIEEAKVSCKEKFRDFAECSQASGLLVVLRCRRENRASEFVYIC